MVAVGTDGVSQCSGATSGMSLGRVRARVK
jgi:hypothetical protein